MKNIVKETAIYDNNSLVIGYQFTTYEYDSQGYLYKPIENEKIYFNY